MSLRSQSVLSLCGELFPALVDPPPTLPKLPSRQNSAHDSDGDEASTARVRRRSSDRKSILAQTVAERMAPSRSSSLELSTQGQRVKFVREDIPTVRASSRIQTLPTVSQPPQHVETSDLQATGAITSPDALPSAQTVVSTESTAVEPPALKGSSRGRKLNFLRRRSSEKSTSLSTRTRTAGLAASPERSDEHRGTCLERV